MNKTYQIDEYYFSKNKRIFDFCLSLLLLIILLPLLILISITILLTAGMPIIFEQKRTGLSGRTFTIYKFRTMKRNAALIKHKYQSLNQAPAPMFKINNDPRFVGIGKFLSRTGIDELPQLINILKGEMSFVGPRPLPTKEAQNLPKNWKSFREKVRPGVFSEWAIDEYKHKSLKHWQKLEEETLKKGGINYFFKITKQTFFSLLRKKESIMKR